MTHQIDVGETEGIDLVPALREPLGHPGLKRGLLAAKTAKLYQAREEGHLLVKVPIHGGAQFGGKTVVLGQLLGFQRRLLFAGLS